MLDLGLVALTLGCPWDSRFSGDVFPGHRQETQASRPAPLLWLVRLTSLQPLSFGREREFLPVPFTFQLRKWWRDIGVPEHASCGPIFLVAAELTSIHGIFDNRLLSSC